MPLPKLKYTREQLEAVRVAVAANGYKMPKAMPVASASPSGALRAEDLEKGLTKGQDDRDRDRDRERRDDRDRNDRRDDRDRRDTRDDRRGGDDRRDGDRRRDDRGRDDRDYRQRDDRQDDRRGGTGRPAEDWGTRGSRNRNREAFEEGYEYELQMKAQKRSILEEAIKAEEVRVAEQKKREAAERAIKDEKESVEKALQIEEEHEKIYEAQQMFGVLSAEETVFSANKNAGKKASRFDFGGDDEEEKKPKVIVDDSVKLDPFVGVQVSSAVHNPKAQQQAQQAHAQGQQGRGGANNAADPRANRQPQYPPQQPQPQQQPQQYQGHHQQQNQHGNQHQHQHQHQHQASHSQQQNQNRGGKPNQNNNNAGGHHGQQNSAVAPQQNKPQPGGFVDPCIVSMSSDVPNVNLSGKQIPNPAPAQNANSSQSHGQQRNNNHHHQNQNQQQQQQQQKNSDSVTALFANAKTTKTPTNVPMQAVDASQLESQLLAKQQVPSQGPNQHRHSPTIGSAGVGVPPTPIMVQMPVAPTSPPQKAASPPPYNAKQMMPTVAAAPQVMQSYVYVPQQAYGMRPQVYIPQQFPPYAMHPGQPQPQGNPQGRH